MSVPNAAHANRSTTHEVMRRFMISMNTRLLLRRDPRKSS
jgi:hypothetical protein